VLLLLPLCERVRVAGGSVCLERFTKMEHIGRETWSRSKPRPAIFSGGPLSPFAHAPPSLPPGLGANSAREEKAPCRARCEKDPSTAVPVPLSAASVTVTCCFALSVNLQGGGQKEKNMIGVYFFSLQTHIHIAREGVVRAHQEQARMASAAHRMICRWCVLGTSCAKETQKKNKITKKELWCLAWQMG
jgi:hypothetical protein